MGLEITRLAFAAALAVVGFMGWALASRYRDIRPAWACVCFFALAPPALVLALVGPSTPLPLVLWSGALVICLVSISHVDWQSGTIPDAIVVPLAVLGLIFSVSIRGDWISGMAVAGGLLGFAVLCARFQYGKNAPIGGGDVLLAVAGIFWVGPALFLDVVILSALLTLPAAAWRFVKGQDNAMIPLAPAFSAALLSVWFGFRLL